MPTWFILSLLAVISWGIWAVLSRWIGDGLTPVQSQALSTLGVLPVMVLLAGSLRSATGARARRGAAWALAAGVLTCAGNVAYYRVLNEGAKAAAVVPLTALYPLVTVGLALALLRERLGLVQWLGVLLSLAAIGMFNGASVEGLFTSWVGLALVPVALWGVSGLLQKIATAHVSGEVATFWFLAAFVPVGGLMWSWEPLPGWPSARGWLQTVALGLSFSLGNLALLAAFARGGQASVIAPLGGLYPLVSVPLAMVCFGERLTGREAVGILLALLGVAALSWEHAKQPGAPGAEPDA